MLVYNLYAIVRDFKDDTVKTIFASQMLSIFYQLDINLKIKYQIINPLSIEICKTDGI